MISCCLREASNHRRLELFGQLCGLSLVQRMGQAYDPKRCSFFFQMLFKFFGGDMEIMVNTFLTNVSVFHDAS
ncbi:hypothetical protein EON65_13565 [archaeon]|nr:MAG: hypothetical protein EON65_13565 [archaeon]